MIILKEDINTADEKFKEVIDKVASMYPKNSLLRYSSMYHMISELGKFYVPQPLPSEYSLGAIKECYRNSAMLALENNDLVYVEGFASLSDVPEFPVAHAWCADNNKKVIDTTWKTPGVAYFGISFTTEYLWKVMRKTKIYGLIPEYPRKGYDPFKDGFPEDAFKN